MKKPSEKPVKATSKGGGMSESLRQIAVLFARQDSIYKTLPGCDVWDIERDARNWPGGSPVVAHPPCRAWGRLRAFAKPRHDEKELALLAVDHVRQFGGVLEHPAASTLWDAAGLPSPGSGRDKFGGWSIQVPQFWFGHRAYKSTWLYFVGIEPKDELAELQRNFIDASKHLSRMADRIERITGGSA